MSLGRVTSFGEGRNSEFKLLTNASLWQSNMPGLSSLRIPIIQRPIARWDPFRFNQARQGERLRIRRIMICIGVKFNDNNPGAGNRAPEGRK